MERPPDRVRHRAEAGRVEDLGPGLFGDQPITASSHRRDVTRFRRRVVQGIAQHLDALDDGFRVYDESGPHAGQQCVDRDDVGRVAHELEQQVERQFRQLDDFVAARDALLAVIDDEIADPPNVHFAVATTCPGGVPR